MSSNSPQPGRYTFGPEMRLHKRVEFDRVFRGGGRAAGTILSVQVMANDLGHSRLGMAVGKSLGNAVARSRVKRLFREAFRLRRHEFAGDWDVVLVPRRPWSAPSLVEIADELVALVAVASRRRRRR